MADRPRLVFIAGPNGAGKSTFASRFLASLEPRPPFINADDIARGLGIANPVVATVEAGKIALTRIRTCLAEGTSFVLETTLSGRAHLGFIEHARRDGWYVELIYVFLASAELSRARVTARVAQGGHQIPTDDIFRRYPRTLANFEHVRHLCDSWSLFDNSHASPRLVAFGRFAEMEIADAEAFATFDRIRRAAES